MGIQLTDLPERYQEQIRQKLAAAVTGTPTANGAPEHDKTSLPENALQEAAERWLLDRGYGRRVPKRLQRHNTGRWFLHFPQARGNPIVLDLLLLDSRSGRYLEVELKVDGGRLSPDQNCLVMRGEGVVCWSFELFRDAVLLWERSLNAVLN